MATSARSPLFGSSDAEQVRRELHGLTGTLLDDLRADLDQALNGSEQATRRYVHGYRVLTRCLLSEARKSSPDMIIDTDAGPMIADMRGRPARYLLDALENAAAEAPFTPWITRFDLGDAVALHLTNGVRAMIGVTLLPPPAEPPRPNVEDLLAERFMRRVRVRLNHPEGEHPLRRLMELFALSKTGLGRLFGVSRQAIDGWLEDGVPAERQDKLGTLLALADLLERKLKPGRVPGVARRPADAYGGETMLGMIAADRHRELLDSVRASFDWSQAA